jgi:hypothetical protein
MRKNINEKLSEIQTLAGGKVLGAVLTDPDGFQRQLVGLRVQMPDGSIRDIFFASEVADCIIQGFFEIHEIPVENLVDKDLV